MSLDAQARQTLGRFRHAYRGRGKPRAHFLHPGKTGGTAVKSALRPVATTGTYRLDLHGHQFVLAQVRAGEKFFFATRDPIARFVSAFYSRQRRGDATGDHAWTPVEAAAFQEFHTANDLAERIARDPRADSAMRGVLHVRSSYSTWFGSPEDLVGRQDDLLLILRQEHLDADFDRLLHKLGLEGRAVLPEEQGAHRGSPGVDRDLSAQAIENLRAWYADDYRFLEVCKSLSADL